MALGQNIEYKITGLVSSVYDEKAAKKTEQLIIQANEKMAKAAAEGAKNTYIQAFKGFESVLNNVLSKAGMEAVKFNIRPELSIDDITKQIEAQIESVFKNISPNINLGAGIKIDIGDQLQKLNAEREKLFRQQKMLQKGMGRVDYLAELPDLASMDEVRPFSSDQIKAFGKTIDEAALKIQDDFTRAEDQLATMTRGTLEYQQALISAYEAASNLYQMKGYVDQNRNKIQDKTILSDYDNVNLADITSDLFDNYHKDLRKVGDIYYEPELAKVSMRIKEIDSNIKQIQQNNPDIINQKAVGAGLKTLDEIEDAYKRILNAHGKVGKQGTNIQNALNFDPLTSKQGIQSLYDAYTKMPDDSPWEVEYQALLKYVRLYESYLTSDNKTHRKKTENPQFKALYEQLKPIAANAENMLQNVLNRANNMPLVGTDVEANQNAAIESQKKAEAEKKARIESEIKANADAESAVNTEKARLAQEALTKAAQQEKASKEATVKANKEASSSYTAGSILDNPMFANMFGKAKKEAEGKQIANEGSAKAAQEELGVTKQTTTELEKQQKLLLYRRVDGQINPNRISNRSTDALYDKNNNPILQEALKYGFGGFGDGLYGSIFSAASNLIPTIAEGETSFFEFDASGYNLFINKTVEQAEALRTFLLSLQKFVGAGTLLDVSELTNIADLSNDQLFKEAQKIFKNFSMTKQQFDAWLESARKESEIIAEMFKNGQVPANKHNFGTRFMQSLGYEGVLNATGDEEYDGNYHGSVIYDPDIDKIKNSMRMLGDEKEFAQYIKSQEKLNQVKNQNPPAQDDSDVHKANADAIEKEVQAQTSLESLYEASSESAKKAIQEYAELSRKISEFNQMVDKPTQRPQGFRDVWSQTDEQKSQFISTAKEYRNIIQQIKDLEIVANTEDDKQRLIDLKTEAIKLRKELSYAGIPDGNLNSYERVYGLSGEDAIKFHDTITNMGRDSRKFVEQVRNEYRARIDAKIGEIEDLNPEFSSRMFKDIPALDQLFDKLNAEKQAVDDLNDSLQKKAQIEKTDNGSAEVVENKQKIQSYEELCQVIERLNSLRAKDQSKLTSAETTERDAILSRLHTTKGQPSPDKVVDDLLQWNSMFVGSLPVSENQMAQYLGIEIPQAANVAKQAIDELNSSLEKKSAIENTDNDGSEVADENAKTEAIKQQNGALKENINLKGQANKQGVGTETITGTSQTLPTQTVPKGTISVEATELEAVRAKVLEVTNAVNTKTQAFTKEESEVKRVITSEILSLDLLEKKVTNIKLTLETLLSNIKTSSSNIGAGLGNITVTVNKNNEVDTKALSTNVVSPPATENTLVAIKSVLDAINSKIQPGTSSRTTSSTAPSTDENALVRYESGPNSQRSGGRSDLRLSEQINTALTSLLKYKTTLQEARQLSGDLENGIDSLYTELSRVSDKAELSTWNEHFKQFKNASAILQTLVKDYQALGQAQAKAAMETDPVRQMQYLDDAQIIQDRIDTKSVDVNVNDNRFEEARQRAFNLTTHELQQRQEIANARQVETERINAENTALREQENIVNRLITLHQEYGILIERAGATKGTNLGVQIADEASAKFAEIQTLIKSLSNGVTPQMQQSFDAAFDRGRATESAKQYEAMAKSIDTDELARVKQLGAEYETLAKLQARADLTESGYEKQYLQELVVKQREIIELKQQGMNIDQALYDTQYLKAYEKELDVLNLKIKRQQDNEEKKNFKQQVKDSQRDAGLTKSRNVVTKANDTLISAMQIEGVSNEQINNLELYRNKIAALESTIANFPKNGVASEEQKQQLIAQRLEVDAYTKEIQELIAQHERLNGENSFSLNATSQLGAGASAADYQKELTQVVQAYTKGKASIKSYDAETKTLTYTLKTGKGEFTTFAASIDKTNGALRAVRGTTTKAMSVFDSIGKKIKEYSYYFTGSMMIMRAIGWVREGINAVKDIDLALTELKKVTDETEESYDRFLNTAAKTSRVIGSTIADYTRATATFAKLGYNMDMASEMAKAAIVYQNVGDGIGSADEAAESIISTMKGFGMQASESMAIVDKFNEVGNRFAITSKGIGDALQRSASALSASGNTLDESIGLITAANEVVNLCHVAIVI